MTTSNLPAIAQKSPLAHGLTVSIGECTHPGPWRLRVWLNGQPIRDEPHKDPIDCVIALAVMATEGELGDTIRANKAAILQRLISSGLWGKLR